jgi:hypothetical protein
MKLIEKVILVLLAIASLISFSIGIPSLVIYMLYSEKPLCDTNNPLTGWKCYADICSNQLRYITLIFATMFTVWGSLLIISFMLFILLIVKYEINIVKPFVVISILFYISIISALIVEACNLFSPCFQVRYDYFSLWQVNCATFSIFLIISVLTLCALSSWQYGREQMERNPRHFGKK